MKLGPVSKWTDLYSWNDQLETLRRGVENFFCDEEQFSKGHFIEQFSLLTHLHIAQNSQYFGCMNLRKAVLQINVFITTEMITHFVYVWLFSSRISDLCSTVPSFNATIKTSLNIAPHKSPPVAGGILSKLQSGFTIENKLTKYSFYLKTCF